MKKIKIILGIITLLTLAFFATGSLIKETKYSVQVSVNKPIKDVFKKFNNIEDSKKWIPEIKTIETIKSNLGKIGNVYKIVIQNQDQEIKMTERVLAYVPNEKVTLFYDAENMLKTNDYVFTERDGVTQIVLKSTCRSDSYLMSCLFPYFKSTFKEQDLSYLNNFKNFVEQQ